MDSPDLTIPLRQMVNVVTLTQALIFASFFIARPARAHLSTWFLVAAFLIMASIKADELYQMLGGFNAYPQYGFILAPIQAAMTPVLYLFVAARTSPDFKLQKSHLLHLTPVILMVLYLTAIYYRFDITSKIDLIESGGLNAPVNRLVVPLLGDIVQLAYLVAAYRLLQKFGVTLRNWFASVENRDLTWLKRMLTVWGTVFLFHAILTLSSAIFDTRLIARMAIDVLDVIHLVMLNLLALLGIADIERRLNERSVMPSAPAAKYTGSAMTTESRTALFEQTTNLLTTRQLYLQPDLTLRDLAKALGAAPRDVSEAINGAGGVSFFEFVNRARIHHAQGLLRGSSEARILEIAFQCGFNSKSAFNDAFKKTTGVTPTQYRQADNSPQNTNQFTAKSSKTPS